MYLGIDLGTPGVKVILMDDQQTIITTSTARLTISRPQSLWSEQKTPMIGGKRPKTLSEKLNIPMLMN